MKRQPAFALSILLVTTVALISHAIAQSDQATSSAELTAATSEQWGEHLVTGDGMSVYLYVLDEDGTLACVDACLNNWPPLLVEEGEEPNLGDGVEHGRGRGDICQRSRCGRHGDGLELESLFPWLV